MSMRERLGSWLLKNKKTVGVDEGLWESSWDDIDWSTTNFASLSKEGYEHVSTVYRCVNLIAKTCASTFIGVFEDTEDGPEIIKDHPFLNVFRRPNPLQSRSAFIKYWITCLLLGGRAFIWANRLENGEVAEYWTIPPSDIDVQLGQTFGTIASMTWHWNGNLFPLNVEDVLYTWFPNPRDFMQPMSPLKAAATEVDLSNEGQRWNLSLLSNYAKSPFVVALEKDAEISLKDDQVNDIKRALRTEYSGSKQVGKVPVLKIAGLKLIPYGWNPQDMDWLKGLEVQDVRIANVFDVPPELIGRQKTYENYREANKAFYNQAVLPVMDLFADELTNWNAVGLDNEQYIAVIRDLIRALQEERNEVADRVTGLVNTGIITRNEARVELKYETSDDPMADVLTVSKEVSTLAVSGFNMGMREVIGEEDNG